ncbi:CocE/NonD family hydrolase [candidate division KSB1 bacterium]|nr:CocE/NonD family hydrolase [candidate division KSB1 bacterium]
MKHSRMPLTARIHPVICITLLMLISMTCSESRLPPDAISDFGRYNGYSKPIFNNWIRTSRYLAISDSVKLAIDIIRPAKDGKPAEIPLPVVWTLHRYHRALKSNGRIISLVDSYPELQRLIEHGYIVVAVDSRGSGASFGKNVPYSAVQARDAYEITEWLARQSWCDGKVGMFGEAEMGIAQLLAASQSPPHLRAIFPALVTFDVYECIRPGGVYEKHFIDRLARLNYFFDLDHPAVPVDEDSLGGHLIKALADHQQNCYFGDDAGALQCRDDASGELSYQVNNPAAYLANVNKSSIPVYLWGGWLDIYARDVFLWYANLSTPKKLAVGPWAHASHDSTTKAERSELYATELLRWFDFWLKEIDNGIMDEPKIHYTTFADINHWTWHSAGNWLLPELTPEKFYFSGGPSQSIKSVNDGLLTENLPQNSNSRDKYVVDYSASFGKAARWRRPVGNYDMTQNDSKGLTFTTFPLKQDMTVTGHPVVSIYVASSVPNIDFHVYLEEIERSGLSRRVTEGMLRASHRAVSKAPYNKLGLPYHRGFKEDLVSLSETEPAQLVFDLNPTSTVFNAGNRIRVTITCADRGNSETLVLSPPPTVYVYKGKQYPSHISLPVMR